MAGGQPDGAGGAAHVAAAGDSDTDAGVAALTAAVEQYVPGAQLLSRGRLAFIAQFTARFSDRIAAEIRTRLR